MEVSERIFELLKRHQKTAKELSEYIDVKPSSISAWKNEGSYPSSKHIVKIADFLEVSLNYLMTGSETNQDSVYLTEDEKRLLEKYSQLTMKNKRDEIISFIEFKISEEQKELSHLEENKESAFQTSSSSIAGKKNTILKDETA